jgi:hypothetical protein
MNMLLWVLQVLLALHTVMGALWKAANPEQTVPSLKAIPHALWLVLIVIELICSVCLIIPIFNKRMAKLAPVAALVIAAEMLLFCAVHFGSGDRTWGEPFYWLVVAAVSAFIAWGRFARNPA